LHGEAANPTAAGMNQHALADLFSDVAPVSLIIASIVLLIFFFTCDI
jgi:hypothetical protein